MAKKGVNVEYIGPPLDPEKQSMIEDVMRRIRETFPDAESFVTAMDVQLETGIPIDLGDDITMGGFPVDEETVEALKRKPN